MTGMGDNIHCSRATDRRGELFKEICIYGSFITVFFRALTLVVFLQIWSMDNYGWVSWMDDDGAEQENVLWDGEGLKSSSS